MLGLKYNESSKIAQRIYEVGYNLSNEYLFIFALQVSLFIYNGGAMWLYASVWAGSAAVLVPLTFLPSYSTLGAEGICVCWLCLFFRCGNRFYTCKD